MRAIYELILPIRPIVFDRNWRLYLGRGVLLYKNMGLAEILERMRR